MYVDLIKVVFLLKLFEKSVISVRRWKFPPSLIDVNFTTNMVWRDQKPNVGFCGQTCSNSEECLSFAYNNIHQSCQGYNRVMLSKESYEFAMTSGVKYFVPNGCEITGYTLNTSLGICFKMFTQLVTEVEADDICKRDGGNLITLDSQEKNDYIASSIANYVRAWYFIGATDSETEGNWIWKNGEPLSNTFWGNQQPNDYDGGYTDHRKYTADCATVSHGGTWQDINCDREHGFICEIQT